MKYPIGILSTLITLIFIGCESSDVVNLPHQEPRLVVNCIGLNDHRWTARVSASKDILDNSMFKGLRDATVKIYENGVYFETLQTSDTLYEPPSEGARYYGSEMKTPQPGNRYKMTAECPGYSEIESEYLQPDSVSIKSLDVKVLGPTTNQNYPQGASDLAITLGFDDPPGENYYELAAFVISESNDQGYNYRATSGLSLLFVDPFYKENNEIFLYTTAVDDKFFDGKSVNLEFTSVLYKGPINLPSAESTLTVSVRNVTKDYYLYLKTTALQRKAAQDPFAQPVLLSNNIINGYGIFGGYTETQKKVIIQD